MYINVQLQSLWFYAVFMTLSSLSCEKHNSEMADKLVTLSPWTHSDCQDLPQGF